MRVINAPRPDVYFDPENPNWPPVASIAITMPALVQQAYPGAAARAALRRAVNAAIDLARKAATAAGRFVRMTAAEIVRGSPFRRARSYEAFGQRNPSFAAAGNPMHAARALLERRSFLDAYRQALQRVQKGIRDAVFPVGTWRMHHELGFARRELLLR